MCTDLHLGHIFIYLGLIFNESHSSGVGVIVSSAQAINALRQSSMLEKADQVAASYSPQQKV